ncbi:MAG: VWA domain-containing protein, partial [Ferrovum sp.]|nr:VWA domain-containing protein [Ferrovum sp.]
SEHLFNAAMPEQVRHIKVQSRTTNESIGQRGTSVGSNRGRYMRALPNENPVQVAVDATLRHAILRNPNEFSVTKADMHEKIMLGKNAILILMVVDASGSMAARKRMELVKASVLGLLEDAYQRRDHVAVIAFRGAQAKLVLPPTRDVAQAEQALRDLPTGGRTPLSHALRLAVETLEQNSRTNALTPLLVIMSDGKGNVPLDEGEDPWRQTLMLSAHLAEQGIPGLVLDTEQDFVRMGRARDLAEALNAEYMPMEGLSAERLTLTIRERLRK